ncbi:C-type lectin 37Db-like [Zeugodacus cucurbitae]|uniref:Perlucin n=1 Tax=Zeugodacus cucurbitae TaxID=28588 RepID=A0A0A1WET0_ZEUCU|nr:C-type lectin 37Db-like [Zeugodacus cucurbitae]
MKQTVILIAFLAALAQCVRADELNDSNSDEDEGEGEDVPVLTISSLLNVRLEQVESDRFIVSLTKMNWFAAYGFCSQQNATILSLELGNFDIKKLKFTEFINIYHLQSRPYWLYGNRLEDGLTFRWGLGGLPVSYTDWQPGQPDNGGGDQQCMKLFPSLMWDDDGCFAQNYAACQKY